MREIVHLQTGQVRSLSAQRVRLLTGCRGLVR